MRLFAAILPLLGYRRHSGCGEIGARMAHPLPPPTRAASPTPRITRKLLRVGVHLVWSTKHRVPYLTAEMRAGVFRYMSGVVKGQRGTLIVAGGWIDHVHLYVELPPNISLSTLVAQIKANSMRWLRATYPGTRMSGWQRGYGAFSADRRHDRRLISYIRDQERIHQRRSTEAERGSLLRAYGLPDTQDHCD